MKKQKIRVLFLDIDGVLNSEASSRFWHWKRQHAWVRPFGSVIEPLCPTAIAALHVLLVNLPEDVKIVISSMWRIGRTVKELQEIFAAHGVDPSRIIDRTPYGENYPNRSAEVMGWINDFSEPYTVTDFLIIDDEAGDLTDGLLTKLVYVNQRVGLTLTNVVTILQFLEGKKINGGA